VNLGKIKKRLKKEAAGHPVKAGVLGVLCLVAVWFWLPLVWKWTAGSKTPATADTAKESESPQVPGFSVMVAPVAAANKEPTVPDVSWKQLIQWMENDPRNKSAELDCEDQGPVATLLAEWLRRSPSDVEGRDPFFRRRQLQPAGTEAAGNRKVSEAQGAPEISPDDAGAILTGIIAGPARGAAMISGRTYFEGEQVLLHKDGGSYMFQLDEVRPAGVVLIRNGIRYELNIPGPAEVSHSSHPAGVAANNVLP